MPYENPAGARCSRRAAKNNGRTTAEELSEQLIYHAINAEVRPFYGALGIDIAAFCRPIFLSIEMFHVKHRDSALMQHRHRARR